MCPNDGLTWKSWPRKRSRVFAFVGDSTTTSFLGMAGIRSITGGSFGVSRTLPDLGPGYQRLTRRPLGPLGLLIQTHRLPWGPLMEHFLTHTVGSHGYLAVFVLMAISSACIPIPSEIVMVFGGALASASFAAPTHQLNFGAVSLDGVAGSLMGSWAAYALGYVGGRPLVERWGRYLLVRPHEVDRAERWFD